MAKSKAKDLAQGTRVKVTITGTVDDWCDTDLIAIQVPGPAGSITYLFPGDVRVKVLGPPAEPAYEEDGVYQDARGNTFMREADGWRDWWHEFHRDGENGYGAPELPMVRLVPEHV